MDVFRAVGFQQLADGLQDLVAGAIAESRVGLRQSIDVDHGHAQAAVVGDAGPPRAEIGLDAGPIQAAGQGIAAVRRLRRAVLLPGHVCQGLCQPVAEHVRGMQQAVRTAQKLPSAAGQVAFVVECGDLPAGRLDLGILHLTGNVKLVSDAFPALVAAREVGQPMLGRFARLDEVAGRVLNAAQHGFNLAQVGRHGGLPQLFVGLGQFRAEGGDSAVQVDHHKMCGAFRQRAYRGRACRGWLLWRGRLRRHGSGYGNRRPQAHRKRHQFPAGQDLLITPAKDGCHGEARANVDKRQNAQIEDQGPLP